MKKDVIYIDIEDDITGVIGKLKASSSKIVALVPPKRATIFNSLVNLKLLKKAAGDEKKRLVIVTADDSLRALAGGLGIYIAQNLTSQPEVPKNAPRPEIPSAVIQASGIERPAGTKIETDSSDGEITATPTPKESSEEQAKKSKKLKPFKKDKKLPDFNSFRKKLLLGGALLVLLLIAWWAAVFALPKAAISLETQQTRVATEFNLKATTDGSDAPEVEGDQTYALSGTTKTMEITQTVDVNPTGEKNVGDKANGTLEILNCGDEFSLVTGTRFSPKNNDLVFVSTEPVTVPSGSCSFFSSNPGEANVAVAASEPGDKYNISEAQYDIVRFSSQQNSQLQISGSKMGGGSTEMVTVVQQSDVDRAVDSISFQDDQETLLNQLKERFEGEVYLLGDALKENTSEADVAPGVGEQAKTAKATVTRTHSIVGVSQSELENVLREAYQSQLSEQQAMVDTGIDQLLTEISSEKDGLIELDVTANGSAGPQLDVAGLKEQLQGLPFSEAESRLQEIPGVVQVSIDLSPFWVSKIPSNEDNINITIAEPQTD